MQRNTDHLIAFGPLSPSNHFPLWYKDSTLTRLELVTDEDLFAPAIGDLPKSGDPLLFPDNYPDEAFYMLVDAKLPTGGTPVRGTARVVLALEAAFAGTGDPAIDQQVVFGRVRLRIVGGVAGGEYTFTHPYGKSEPKRADENGKLDITEDIGVAPQQFAGALGSEIGPFLRWTSGADRKPGEAEAPAGYLGDGFTPHTITGSKLMSAGVPQNFILIEGPNIGDAGDQRDPNDRNNVNKIYTDLFTVQGRLARTAGAQITRAVYRCDAAGAVVLDIFASSEIGQVLQASGIAIAPTVLREQAETYFARIATGTTLPASVDVTNTTDVPTSKVSHPIVDYVTVERAEYDTNSKTLTVEASSSDLHTPPALQAKRLGPLTAGIGVFNPREAPPVEVTVTSSRGGSGSRTTTIVGAPTEPIPVTAIGGVDQSVQRDGGQPESTDARRSPLRRSEGSGQKANNYRTALANHRVGLRDGKPPTPIWTATQGETLIAVGLRCG
jgi:hypothetical protein